MADKMINDPKQAMCVKADGPMHFHEYKSSICPMKYSFKCGEEFDFPNPIDPTDINKVGQIANYIQQAACIISLLQLFDIFIKPIYMYL